MRRAILEPPTPAKKRRRQRKPRPFQLNLRNTVDPVGTVFVADGQRYKVIRVDHNDRNQSWLVWETHCAECGIVFEATTTRNFKGYITRRCLQHRGVGRIAHLV